MASRIPVIDQSIGVGTGGPTYARATPTQDSIGPALQNLGAGLSQAAQGQMALDNANTMLERQKQHQDAAVWAGNVLSDAQLNQGKVLESMKEQAQPGAPDFTPTYLKQYDDWSKDAIEKAPNPDAKRFLQTHLLSLRTSLGQQAMAFEAQSRMDNRIATVTDTMDKSAQVVMSQPTDDVFKTTYAQQKAVIDTLEVLPTQRRQLLDQLHTKMTTAYWLGRIRQDPDAAARDLKTGLPVSPLEQLKTGTSVPGQTGVGGGTVSDIWPALVRQESGGNQAAVSPKGAIGVAQIMPTTAPEAAALAGLPYDENRLKTDRAYNEALGQAYLGKQLQTFGNMPQALAAYNAGPGAVQKAIDKAQSQGGQWLDYLPKETQGYVTSIMSKGGGAARPVLLADASGGLPAGAIEPSGSAVLDSTPMNVRLQMIQHADTEMNRMQAVYRSQITTTENDHVAAYMNGQPVAKPLTQADYVKAYGPLEGVQRFENYIQIAQVGGDISALKLATPEQMQATLAKYTPDSSKPGYDLAVKRYELVAKAVDQVNTARMSDPMAYAQQVKIGDAKPLPFNDQDAFAAELAKRAGVANTMQTTYGAPFQMLTKAESATLSKGFQTMTTQQKIGYLNTIRNATQDPAAYRSVMQQISPDSPVTAMAGVILSKQNPIVVPHTFSADTVYKQQDVAGLILDGEALLNPSKAAKSEDGKPGRAMQLPADKDMRTQFDGFVGKAFAGDPAGADFAYQAVKAYYVGKAARDGDVSGVIDGNRMKEALDAVTGGVSDINGKGQVVRPWGMGEERFKNGVKSAYDLAMQRAGYAGSQLDIFGAYGLQSAGDSKYLLRSGTGYLTDKGGNPIVLDLSENPAGGQILNGRGWTGRVTPENPVSPPAGPQPGIQSVKPAKATRMNTASPNTK